MARQTISSGHSFEPVLGYSRAVKVGNSIHVSGTTSNGADAYDQATKILKIIKDALVEAGAGPEHVVRTVIYVTDMELHANGVTKAHGEMFGDIRPASTLVAVSGLLRPELFVEIEVYAIVEDG